MINTNFKVEEKQAQAFDPIPENIYQVELLDCEVQEKPSYNDKNVMENVFSFQFTILSGKDKDGTNLRGRNLWLNFVPVYFYIGKKGKNKLYQVIETLVGRELTPEELATFEANKINSFIGKQCRVFIKNKTSADGKNTFSNIDSLLPTESLLTALTTEEKAKAQIKKEPQEQSPQEQFSQEVDKKAEQVLEKQSEIDIQQIPF